MWCINLSFKPNEPMTTQLNNNNNNEFNFSDLCIYSYVDDSSKEEYFDENYTEKDYFYTYKFSNEDFFYRYSYN